MTEEEWLTMSCPEDAFELRWELTSQRKLRLIAVAFCRRAWVFGSESSQRLVELAERYADGAESADKLGEAPEPTRPYMDAALHFDQAARMCAVRCDSQHCVFEAAQAMRTAVRASKDRPTVEELEQPGLEGIAQAAILRDIVGNPFRPVSLNPAWLTSDVLLLAQGIYADRAFDRMPILADALQDAGCDNDDMLNHCRDPNQVHVRGCWVVDLLLGKQ